jgi:primosomal replication protein N
MRFRVYLPGGMLECTIRVVLRFLLAVCPKRIKVLDVLLVHRSIWSEGDSQRMSGSQHFIICMGMYGMLPSQSGQPKRCPSFIFPEKVTR